MAEAFSETLAYPQVKKRAVASRSFRTKITPSNGSTFSGGNTIHLDLPGNLAGQYYNPNQMYLKFKIQNSVAAVQLDRAGAASCIKRVQIQTAGAQLYDCNNWNVLATALMDTDASADWKASSGSVLMGTQGSALQGELIGATDARTYCVPMMLNPLSMTTPHRLIPAFSLSALQFRITLENDALVGVTGAPVFTYSDVEMVCLMTELSPGAQAQIDSMTGGQYNILANSYINSQATLDANVTSLTANLGISVSSLERILVVHRPSATATAAAAFSLGNRTTSALTEFQFLINSENYPQRPILVDGKGAESYAELLIADHALVDFRKGNCILNSYAAASATQAPANTNPLGTGALSGNAPGVVKNDCFRQLDGAGTTAGTAGLNAAAVSSNVGTFLAACEFESGLSDGKSSHIYSGISTIASVVQYKGTYGGVHAAANVDFFAQHTIMISLDMRGSGVYAVSV